MNQHVIFGKQRVAVGAPPMARLRDSSAASDDPQRLRAILAEDGYLLIRGLYDRQDVLAARHELLERHAEAGLLLPGSPVDEGRINPSPPANPPYLGHGSPVTRGPAFLRLVEGPRVMRFFDRLFGEPSLTFDFKWLRVMPTGACSPAHFDNSYMGRGSQRLHSVWTPLGDVGYEQGPLAVIPGTHRLPGYARLRETLGMMDVDRDQVRGDFAENPFEITERFGGSWATAEFQAGDALIFNMFLLHASAENTTDCFRLSSDTRYQPAADAVDERWVGENPKGHYAWFVGDGVSMAHKRQEWSL